MRELPAGADAVLLDFAGDPQPDEAVLAAAAALRAAHEHGALAEVTDVVPTAHTVLVQAAAGHGIDLLGIHRVLRQADADDPTGAAELAEVEIPVSYDGEDVEAVAAILGVDGDEVAAIHQRTRWRVQFMGFAPGFGYLVPADESENPFAAVGRRDESRPRVPAGAVAVAAGYSAVYPKESPGGWHLLGHTDARLWDVHRDPPALLAPGRIVRFVDAGNSR